VPKKSKHVQPVYPAEALAQGIRGIVILELLVDASGKVGSTSIIRSVPGLDDAAIAAASQWQYEPVKVDGKPVSVRLTVPITFALALPKLDRDSGIPELRQGATPAWPAGDGDGGAATADVTLDPDGRVGSARITDGDEPWASALLAALKTWRFPPPEDDAVVSFRVSAEFVSRGGQKRVDLRASGLRRAELLAAAQPGPAADPDAAAAPAAAPVATPTAPADSPRMDAPPPATGPPSAPTPAPQEPAPPPTAPAAPPESEPTPAAPPAGAPAAPGSAPDAVPPPTTPPVSAAPPGRTPAAGTAGAPASPLPPADAPADSKAPPADRTAAPPVEVITAPAPQAAPENGVSAVRDVALQPGVPDLARGRRPVPPPLARINGTTGTVEVAFSVSAAGATTIQEVSGPEPLRRAAQDAVLSWVFRRTRADRAYLVAVFAYGEDAATVEIRPQPAPVGTPEGGGAAAGAPPSPGAPPSAPAPPPGSGTSAAPTDAAPPAPRP
jgi:TonB family protein